MLVKALLRKGANLNARIERALTAFEKDINVRTYTGRTALHQATETGRADVIEFLIRAGADVNDNGGGVTPLELVKEKKSYSGEAEKYEKIARILKARGAKE